MRVHSTLHVDDPNRRVIFEAWHSFAHTLITGIGKLEPKTAVVWRGVCGDWATASHNYGVTRTVIWHGFSSTTMDTERAYLLGYAAHFDKPAGTSVWLFKITSHSLRYIGNLSLFEDESEFLLMPQTSLVVTGISTVSVPAGPHEGVRCVELVEPQTQNALHS